MRSEKYKLQYEILIDSDAFIGLMLEPDAHHKRAYTFFTQIKKQRLEVVTTSFVIAETATVLSNRKGQETARAFLDFVEKIPTIHITEELQKEATLLFKQQNQRGTSLVDCSNVVVMRWFNIPTLFGFDKFYNKYFGLQTVA